MKNNKRRTAISEKPLEKHNTAAWANISKTKAVSNVTVPSNTQIKNAKEYVDTNEK